MIRRQSLKELFISKGLRENLAEEFERREIKTVEELGRLWRIFSNELNFVQTLERIDVDKLHLAFDAAKDEYLLSLKLSGYEPTSTNRMKKAGRSVSPKREYQSFAVKPPLAPEVTELKINARSEPSETLANYAPSQHYPLEIPFPTETGYVPYSHQSEWRDKAKSSKNLEIKSNPRPTSNPTSKLVSRPARGVSSSVPFIATYTESTPTNEPITEPPNSNPKVSVDHRQSAGSGRYVPYSFRSEWNDKVKNSEDREIKSDSRPTFRATSKLVTPPARVGQSSVPFIAANFTSPHIIEPGTDLPESNPKASIRRHRPVPEENHYLKERYMPFSHRSEGHDKAKSAEDLGIKSNPRPTSSADSKLVSPPARVGQSSVPFFAANFTSPCIIEPGTELPESNPKASIRRHRPVPEENHYLKERYVPFSHRSEGHDKAKSAEDLGIKSNPRPTSSAASKLVTSPVGVVSSSVPWIAASTASTPTIEAITEPPNSNPKVSVYHSQSTATGRYVPNNLRSEWRNKYRNSEDLEVEPDPTPASSAASKLVSPPARVGQTSVPFIAANFTSPRIIEPATEFPESNSKASVRKHRAVLKEVYHYLQERHVPFSHRSEGHDKAKSAEDLGITSDSGPTFSATSKLVTRPAGVVSSSVPFIAANFTSPCIIEPGTELPETNAKASVGTQYRPVRKEDQSRSARAGRYVHYSLRSERHDKAKSSEDLEVKSDPRPTSSAASTLVSPPAREISSSVNSQSIRMKEFTGPTISRIERASSPPSVTPERMTSSHVTIESTSNNVDINDTIAFYSLLQSHSISPQIIDACKTHGVTSLQLLILLNQEGVNQITSASKPLPKKKFEAFIQAARGNPLDNISDEAQRNDFVSLLQSHSVPSQIIESFKSLGINSITEIVALDEEKINQLKLGVKPIPKKKFEAFLQAAREGRIIDSPNVRKA